MGKIETVTIPRVEYEALIHDRESLEDLRAYDEAKANLANGEEELLPADFVDRLIEGESPLTLWREHRGISKVALSELSGVNRVQITDIEKGRNTGSVETLKKLADALKVKIDDLV